MSDSVARGDANPQTIRELAEAIRRRCLRVSTPRDAQRANDATYADIMRLLDALDDAKLCVCDQHLGRFLTIHDPAPRGDAE